MDRLTGEATRRSTSVRFERAQIRAAVRRGVSLSVLLRERREALEGVRVVYLAQWLPRVGPTKAERILLGLPHHYRLRELKPSARSLLVERITNAERYLIQQRLREDECPPST